MTPAEVRQLNEDNYEYIKALSIIATELIQNGKIILDFRCANGESILVIENDNIRYTLHTFNYDTCKSIEWERRKEK